MEKNLAKNYDPRDFEERIYEMWESKGCFKAEADENKKPFTIVMPPPNITGQLHMGHALDQTLQMEEDARVQRSVASRIGPCEYSYGS